VSLRHPTAEVDASATLEPDVRVWQHVQVREHASIGARTVLGMGCYIDSGVRIGADCKLQNYVCTYAGLTLEDGVFCGPCVVFTNDRVPRAINKDGSIKGPRDWTQTKTFVAYGASIGANATIVCGVRIGRFAMIGAGSVVTQDVPDHALVFGNPARVQGFVSAEGKRLQLLRLQTSQANSDALVAMICPETGEAFSIPIQDYRLLSRS
jgi:UDP-2-acetamido-3-amino-2,3-dideoxy-glucuronate N-acetyltransferase